MFQLTQTPMASAQKMSQGTGSGQVFAGKWMGSFFRIIIGLDLMGKGREILQETSFRHDY